MTSALLILAVVVVLLVIIQVATVYFFLQYIKVAPPIKIPLPRPIEEENDFQVEDDKYMDLTDVPPDIGVTAFRKDK